MVKLLLHSTEVQSIFQLLGHHENDISFSVAWALSKCPNFLTAFLTFTVGEEKDLDQVEIRLQDHESKHGFTDIEIELKDRFYVIVEAKRGWVLPGEEQLTKYARKKTFLNSKAPKHKKCLIAMSECAEDYAKTNLGMEQIDGLRVKAVSWANMASMARKSAVGSTHAQKRLIGELLTYFRGLMTMQNMDSNLVYVVVIADRTPEDWKISFIDIVEKRHRYFHPVGTHGWPKEPPNYMGFRYRGRLQSIHHVDSYEIVRDFDIRKYIPEVREKPWQPHFLYKLGPAIKPTKLVKPGKIYPNGRVWCMLDTLLTCDTISKARDLTQERLKPTI